MPVKFLGGSIYIFQMQKKKLLFIDQQYPSRCCSVGVYGWRVVTRSGVNGHLGPPHSSAPAQVVTFTQMVFQFSHVFLPKTSPTPEGHSTAASTLRSRSGEDPALARSPPPTAAAPGRVCLTSTSLVTARTRPSRQHIPSTCTSRPSTRSARTRRSSARRRRPPGRSGRSWSVSLAGSRGRRGGPVASGKPPS